jgi:hypothetical protein
VQSTDVSGSVRRLLLAGFLFILHWALSMEAVYSPEMSVDLWPHGAGSQKIILFSIFCRLFKARGSVLSCRNVQTPMSGSR